MTLPRLSHCGGAALALAAFVSPVFAQMTKQQARAAWEMNWAAVDDLEVEYDQFTTSETPRDDLVAQIHYRYRTTEGAFLSVEQQPGKPAVRISYDAAARQGRMMLGNNGWFRRGIFSPAAATWAYNILRPPIRGESEVTDAQCDLTTILASEESRVAGAGDVDGTPAVIVEVGDVGAPHMRIWLDPVRNCVPLRWSRLRPGGEAAATVNLRDYRLFDDCWLPLEAQVFWGSGEQSGACLTQRISLQSDCETPQVIVNARWPAEAFRLEFCMDSLVLDDDTGASYRVTPGGLVQEGVALRAPSDRTDPTRVERFARGAGLATSGVGLLAAVSYLIYGAARRKSLRRGPAPIE